VDDDALVTITAPDLLASRVFTDNPESTDSA
jgi:hypothetical protein